MDYTYGTFSLHDPYIFCYFEGDCIWCLPTSWSRMKQWNAVEQSVPAEIRACHGSCFRKPRAKPEFRWTLALDIPKDPETGNFWDQCFFFFARLNLKFHSINIGQILFDEGLISTKELETIRKLETDEGISPSEALIKLNLTSEYEILFLASKHLKIPLIDLENYCISPETIKIIPISISKELGIVTINKVKDTLFIAISREMKKNELDELETQMNLQIKCFFATEDAVLKALNE